MKKQVANYAAGSHGGTEQCGCNVPHERILYLFSFCIFFFCVSHNKSISLTNINMKSSKKSMGLDFEAGTKLPMSCFKSGPPVIASGILLGELVTCDVLLVVSHLTPPTECGFQEATDSACLVLYVPRTHHNLT